MSNDGLQEGTLRQLDDGRILLLYKPSEIADLVWVHICNKDNGGWGVHARFILSRASVLKTW